MEFFNIHFVEKNLKCERGDLLGFFNIHSCKISEKLKGETFEDIEKFSFKSFTKPKRGRLIVPKTEEKGTLRLWNESVFHVKDFPCVQNQVLNTYGKSAHSAQKVDHSE